MRRHFGGWSRSLDYGASEEELRYALEALDGRPKIPYIQSGPTTYAYTYTEPLCGDMAVERTPYSDSMSEGYRYVVTFPVCDDGDAPDLYGDA